MLNRRTEYCSELHNHESNGCLSVLKCPQTDTEDDNPILHKAVEAAVQSLKKGNSARVHNFRAALIQTDGEAVITAPTTICNKIWQTGKWPIPWTQCFVITLTKKVNLKQYQKYRPIGLTSHPSKVMPHILNGLKPQAEKITTEKQADFRAGRHTTEQILNLKILCEKHLQH